MLRKQALANAHFVLLGRSQLIEETQTWIDWNDEQLNTRKMALRESMVQESEDGKVTMVDWNRNWQKFTRSQMFTLHSIDRENR